MNSKLIKRGLLSIMFIFLFVEQVSAQSVSYSNKPLDENGYTAKLSISKRDSAYILMVRITSDKVRFLNKPVLLIRTFSNEVIKLTGEDLGTNAGDSYGIPIGGMVLMGTEMESAASFILSPEIAEKFKDGISKIRLSVHPANFQDKVFKKDKIGKKLYGLYIHAKSIDDTF